MIKTTYVIYELDEEGRLRHPKDLSNDFLFDIFGYESRTKAKRAISKSSDYRLYTVLGILYNTVAIK